MHTTIQTRKSQSVSGTAARIVLHMARALHRAAESESLAVSLPVLRRLLATASLTNISLPELYRRRDMVQRKHLLRMLAVEAEFKCWEDYRHALDEMSEEQIVHFDHLRRSMGYPNLWFSSFEEARDYAWDNNGRALRVGSQAVVIIEQVAF